MPDLLPTFTCWRCGAECDVDWIDVGTLGSVEPEVIQGVTRCTNERCIGRFDRLAHAAPSPEQLIERCRRALERVYEIARETP